MRRLLHAVGAGAVTGAVTALLVAGCSSAPDDPSTQVQVTSQAPPSSRSLPEAQQAPGAPVVAGYTVSIGKLGVRSSLVQLGLNADRTVQVPALDQPQQVGHYRGSPLPGAVGPSVLLAHISGRVDGRSVPGAFSKLGQLAAGDRIDVAAPDGLGARTLRFEVYRVQTVEKEAFPTSAVYGRTDGPELRLVTCGGVFDKANRNYLSNVIVYARLAQ